MSSFFFDFEYLHSLNELQSFYYLNTLTQNLKPETLVLGPKIGYFTNRLKGPNMTESKVKYFAISQTCTYYD